jgi:hypothetical protein
MIIRVVVTALALACTASAAAGQSLTQVQPGARIRVTQPVFVDGVASGDIHRPQVGTLVRIDSTSITALLEKDGTLLTLPFIAIKRFQISEGAQSSNRGSVRGMLTGALVGALFGALYECSPIEDGPPCPDRKFADMLPSIAVGSLGGGALGCAIGSRQRESWRELDLLSLPVAPRTRQLDVSVSLRF